MKIETKFNLGDEVFMLNGTKLEKMKVNSLKVDVNNKCEIEVSYFFFDENRNCTLLSESKVFASKEEFLNQLETE